MLITICDFKKSSNVASVLPDSLGVQSEKCLGGGPDASGW